MHCDSTGTPAPVLGPLLDLTPCFYSLWPFLSCTLYNKTVTLSMALS